MTELVYIRFRKSDRTSAKRMEHRSDASSEPRQVGSDTQLPPINADETFPEVKVRDRGPGVTLFGDVLRCGSRSFLEVHTFFNQRVGTSDHFLYHRLIPHLFRQREESISVVLPIGRTLSTAEPENIFLISQLIDVEKAHRQLLSILGEEERRFLRTWSEVKRRGSPMFDVASLVARRRCGQTPSAKIVDSIEYQIAKLREQCSLELIKPGSIGPKGIIMNPIQDLEACSRFLEQIYSSLVRRESPFKDRLVVLIDLLGPLGDNIKEVLRWFIRDGSDLGATVWLHCSLMSVPSSFLAQFSNYVVFRPSAEEVDLLTRVLPSANKDIQSDQYRQKVLLYGPCVGMGQWEIFG